MGVNGDYIAYRVKNEVLGFLVIFRESLLTEVLSGFQNIGKRADAIADAEYERLGSLKANHENFDGDLSQEAEVAMERGYVFYETMTGLRQATINLWAAGLYHLLEQQLASICEDPKFYQEHLPAKRNLDDVADWYKQHLGLNFRGFPQWEQIKELQSLANSVKHGEGNSAEKLRKANPSLFLDPLLGQLHTKVSSSFERLRLPLAGSGLFVTEEAFGEYAQIVVDFVSGIARHFSENAATLYPCA